MKTILAAILLLAVSAPALARNAQDQCTTYFNVVSSRSKSREAQSDSQYRCNVAAASIRGDVVCLSSVDAGREGHNNNVWVTPLRITATAGSVRKACSAVDNLCWSLRSQSAANGNYRDNCSRTPGVQ